MRGSSRLLSILAPLVTALALCGPVSAAPVTIGQLAPPNPEAVCNQGPSDGLVTSASIGTSYTVPAPGGVITSWSTEAAIGAGQSFKFKVYRPAPSPNFLVVGQDLRSLTPSTRNTFPVDIPVQAGDVIGFNDQNAEDVKNACIFSAPSGGIIGISKSNDGPTGVTESFQLTPVPFLANVSATMLPTPTVTGLTPGSGSIKGGTNVAIAGTNLIEVKSVSFGTTPAPFKVDSEGQITAVAPASATLAKVPVSVTTRAGTATSSQVFAYAGCTVPKLVGKKLKAVKKALKKGGCKLGKVTKKEGAGSKTGKVSKQKPKKGVVLAPGAKVKVTLSA